MTEIKPLAFDKNLAEEVIRDLVQKGYFLFKHALNESEIANGKRCIENGQVWYAPMIHFVQTVMLAKINKHLGWNTEYIKFRVSDNNNSTDASTFHRDILCHDSQSEVYPVYTLLLYLDQTSMQVIPGSHQKPAMNYWEAAKTYFQKKKLIINPGDLLLFYSTMLHRGIFTEKAPHRRLIQIFEVYPNQDSYQIYAGKFLHIPAKPTRLGRLMILASKIKPIIALLNLFGYVDAATGYGYSTQPLKNTPLSSFSYLSSEGLQPRIKIDPNQKQEINRYVLQKTVHNLPLSYQKIIHFRQYERQFIIYLLVLLTTIIFISIMAKII